MAENKSRKGDQQQPVFEIRVEDFDEGRSPGGAVDPPSPTLGSPAGSGTFREREGSFKARTSNLLHHFLHPLDYYHERKSRSSTSSINSDLGDPPGDASPRSRTPESPRKSKTRLLPRPLSPSFFQTSSSPWPVIKAPLRKRVSCPSPSQAGSPPHLSPRTPPPSVSCSRSRDFYRSGPADERRSEGHRLGRADLARHSVSPEMLIPNRDLGGALRPGCGSPRPAAAARRNRRQLEKTSCSSTSSSSVSSRSECESEYDSSDSYSASVSSSEDDEAGRRRRRRRGSGPRVDIPSVKISIVSPEAECSPSEISPTNKFLLSVSGTDIPNGVPVRRSDGKSRSYDVSSGRHRCADDLGDLGDDEVFSVGESPSHRSLHVGMRSPKSMLDRISSVERLYSVYEQIIREGNGSRLRSGDVSSSQSQVYLSRHKDNFPFKFPFSPLVRFFFRSQQLLNSFFTMNV